MSKSGTILFWSQAGQTPVPFTVGINHRWMSLNLGGQECEVVSEGKVIRVREQATGTVLLDHTVSIDGSGRHHFAVTWTPETIKLHIDGKEAAQAALTC